jgi:hypothetical protein
MTWRTPAAAVGVPELGGLPWAWATGTAASKLTAKQRAVVRIADMGLQKWKLQPNIMLPRKAPGNHGRAMKG